MSGSIIDLMIYRYDPRAILVVTDDDGRCLRYAVRGDKLGTALLVRPAARSGEIKLGVVIATRCYEAWLLAMKLGKTRDVDAMYAGSAQYAAHLERLIGRRYDKTSDQGILSNELPLDDADRVRHMIACSRSYKKLLRVLEALTETRPVSNLGISLYETDRPQHHNILRQCGGCSTRV